MALTAVSAMGLRIEAQSPRLELAAEEFLQAARENGLCLDIYDPQGRVVGTVTPLEVRYLQWFKFEYSSKEVK